jgi:hypothetical protein
MYRPMNVEEKAPPASSGETERYGWMSKKGKDRWFLLRDHVLYWFVKEQPLDCDIRKEVRGSLQLEHCTVSPMQQDSFSITSPDGSLYLLVCRSVRERDDWLRAVEATLQELNVLMQTESKRTGWLEKKKQKRWFVLQEESLTWYAKEGDVRERGQLNLGECNVVTDDSKTFTLVNLKDENVRYQLVAKNADEARGWVSSLQRACEKGKKKESDVLKARAMARQNAEARKGSAVTLEKKGWFVKKRKRRYYVLHNTLLMWFVNETDSHTTTSMKGSLEMLDCAVTARGFDLNIRTKEGVMYVLTAGRKQDVDDWASAIKDACNAAQQMRSSAGKVGMSSSFVDTSKRGWAVKKGKKRFLVLKQGELLYFDREQSGAGDSFSDKPKGTIKLATASANEVTSGSFLVRSEGSKDGWVFETPEASEWVVAISASIGNVSADSGLSHSGWMVKKGKRRWFALKKGTVMWFNDVQAAVDQESANGFLLLKRCRIVEDAKSRTITVTPHAESGEKPLEVVCYNSSDLAGWLHALKGGQADAAQTTMVDPFASTGNGLVFGRPIEEVLEREGTTIPQIVTLCCEYLREVAMEHSGVFRLSGSSGEINKLRDVFDAGEVVDFFADEVDRDCVAGLLKLYIRQLPEPPLSFGLYKDFLAVNDDPTGLRDLVDQLPQHNYDFLVYLIGFLGDIAELSEVNQMTPSNIAIVMGPNLLRQREGEGDLVSGLKDTPLMLSCCKNLVAHRATIFGI